ncbi:hypothetical protein BDR07DRAFT_1381249 [Suillus spraguei]|nr:hypothetical protein BDR07DRAFT_1381249 [Suillus spraguei]
MYFKAIGLLPPGSSWYMIGASGQCSKSIDIDIIFPVLTLGQEIELIWAKSCFYTNNPLVISIYVLMDIPVVSLTDAGCNIIFYATNWTNIIVAAMLSVIMIARLYAMYQRSRITLIFLVIISLAVNIACGVIAAIVLKGIVWSKLYLLTRRSRLIGQTQDELILSGTYMCDSVYVGNTQRLITMVWTLNTVWEVLALCLSVWIAMKHFRDLRQLGSSTGSTVGDCFKILIKSHVLYFSCFAGVSCLQLVGLSPELLNSGSVGTFILGGALQILTNVQMFVLGPRLILSVREYHAKLVADSDVETSMNSIVFEERVHVSTSSTV